MTMDHVREPASDARRSLGALAAAVRARRADVDKALRGLDVEADNAVIGARAAVQAIEDDRTPLLHELGQHKGVLGITDDQPPDGPTSTLPSTSGSTTATTPPSTSGRRPLFKNRQLQAMSNEEISELCETYGYETVIDNSNRYAWIEWIVEVQSEYCKKHGIDDPNQVGDALLVRDHTVVYRFNPLRWGWWEIIGAVIGIIVGALVWSTWPEWIGRNMDPSGVRTALNALWLVLLVCVGFFGGAIIGAKIEDRNDDS